MLWSPKQSETIRSVHRWMLDPHAEQVYVLFGYAGTGKTELAKHLAGEGWLFAAYTGKAAYVLQQRGCIGASTIHSLIYRPAGESLAAEIKAVELKMALITSIMAKRELTIAEQRELRRLKKSREDLIAQRQPRFAIWEGSPLWNARGLVIDEVSMVDADLGRDLESFGKKILVLGDPAQLPPVGAGGYYTKRSPHMMLTEVHRHARESGILRLATIIREGGSIDDFGDSTSDVTIVNRPTDAFLTADQALCGMNATRRSMNVKYRQRNGIEDPLPQPGDRLVCLKNDRSLGLFNGSQWRVLSAESDTDSMTTVMRLAGEEKYMGEVQVTAWLHHMLGQEEELKSVEDRRYLSEFDWSYALTVHKAQGSQWQSVALLDQSQAFRGSARKWLYTGITRAAKHLTLVR